MTKTDLLAMLAPWGQEHLVAFWDQLDVRRRESLAAQIQAIDFAQFDRLWREPGVREDFARVVARAGVVPAIRLADPANRFAPEEARRRGQEALRSGGCGVILVAGGVGTRLGFDQPKGMFPIGPISGRSLFQVHVEKIVATGRRYGVRVPLYLMTSPATHEATVEFFARQERFGLRAEDLVIFCQGTMPAVDAETGRVLLEAPDRVAVSPDGHGGMLAAMADTGALADARRRGIATFFYFQVDNPLADVLGPEFLGYHMLAGSELSTQVIAKRNPLEKVGNVVAVDGRLRVIEYSDLPDDLAHQRTPDGSLRIWAGSIGIHAIERAFLEEMAGRSNSLPLHRARKKVASIDPAGADKSADKRGRESFSGGVAPEGADDDRKRLPTPLFVPLFVNAIKFERFIFDLLPAAAHAIVVEVDRDAGFAPLKNASGDKHDTPESVRAQMVALHAQWLRQAGAEVAPGALVEIDPAFALDAEELAGRVRPGMRVAKSTYFHDDKARGATGRP